MSRKFSASGFFAACLSALCLPGCDRQAAEPSLANDSKAALTARALKGDPDSIAELGRNYMTGASGYPLDAGKAREMFEFAAQRGSGAGLFYLGLLAYGGQAGAPDVKEACGLFAQSAARGHPGGLREYGECQLRGIGGIAKDPRSAADLFKASIAKGGVQAYESLARLYGSGEGVAKDPLEQARLLQKRDALRASR
jgi:TPR repeat protein